MHGAHAHQNGLELQIPIVCRRRHARKSHAPTIDDTISVVFFFISHTTAVYE